MGPDASVVRARCGDGDAMDLEVNCIDHPAGVCRFDVVAAQNVTRFHQPSIDGG